MRKIYIGLSVLLLVSAITYIAMFNQNKKNLEPADIDFFAMDTYMTVSAYGTNAEDTLVKIKNEVLRLESLWSVTLETSEISILNREKSATVSADTKNVLEIAKQVAQQSDHAFDITIMPVMRAWGFHSRDYRVPSTSEFEELKQYVDSEQIIINGHNIVLNQSYTEIDLGAIAKGYASQKISEMLISANIDSAIISLGGNVQVVGTKPDGTLWKVAVQNPNDTESYVGILELENEAAVTSGIYQRYFEADNKIYHHLIDPSTGFPADNGLASVTIISKDGTLADALSTVAFIMGIDKAVEFWQQSTYEFEMIFIETDGTISLTEGAKDSFSPIEGSIKNVFAK